jgi:ketosteroid isomerase-like protein
MKSLLLSTVIAVVLACPVVAQTADQKRKGADDADLTEVLMALTRQEDEAEIKRDTATVRRLLADDFVVTDPSGAKITKAEYLKNVEQPPEAYQGVKGYTYEDFKVYRHGDTAVANYVLTMTRQDKTGKETAERMRPTVVWVKKNGSWQVVTFCITPLNNSTKNQ